MRHQWYGGQPVGVSQEGKWQYLVSYAATVPGSVGFRLGSAHMVLDRPITTYDLAMHICQVIQQKWECGSTVVLQGWQLLSVPAAELLRDSVVEGESG